MRAAATRAAAPLLIAACVLFTLRGFAFRPLLTNRHVDILGFWLPRFAFLGRSLRAGHIPLWNPYEMLGYRFAADPQSGWLYLPAMLFFTVLGAGAAMRALIVFNPLLAGLGLYWFLRKESLSRPAACVGGLSLAMLMSTSYMAISLPFAGFLAWTTVALVGASGFRRAERTSRRLAWLGLAGLGWSQVANAHMSHGLVMCTVLVAFYLGSWAIADVRAGRRSGKRTLAWIGCFFAFLPLASLAIFIPRLGFIGSSSLQAGYTAVDTPGSAGIGAQAILSSGLWSGWPLTYGVTPGPYLGAVTLLAIPLSLRARRWRPLVWAFGGAFALSYLLTNDALVSAGWFRALMLKLPFGDVYLHYPGRFWYLSMIAFPVLGAIGVQGLAEDSLPWRRAVRWLAPGAGLFLLVPLALGGHLARYAMLAVMFPVAGAALAWGAGRKRGPVVVVGVLAAELLAGAVYANVYHGGTVFSGLETGHFPDQVIVPQPLRFPEVSQSAFLRPTPFVDVLRRTPNAYLTWSPPAAYYQKGYLFTQKPTDWPALVMERGTLFGIRDVLGYNPVQLPRYWTYIRAIDPLSVFYNASVINRPTLSDARVLGVRYLIVPEGVPPALPGRVVVSDAGYRLVQIDGWEPRVSVVPSWTVTSPASALRLVTTGAFNPDARAVVEREPGIAPVEGGSPGTAAYSEASPGNVQVAVNASAPSIVVIRTAYDPGWSATVDGTPTPVFATDYVDQGVAVPAGNHDVRLVYHDPAIGRGLVASGLVWLILALAVAVAVRKERRAAPVVPPGAAAP